LYSPGGTFLGELIVDNPRLNLQLEGTVSTFEFEIVENIDRITSLSYNFELQRNESTGLNSEINPRLNEALDQFQVEVWYGDLDTQNYQKQRFIIIDTPNSFGNDITRFSYKAYSRDYENRFIRVLDWPGILINEYVDTFTATSYNVEQSFELSYIPRDERLVRVDLVKDFIQRLINIKPSNTPLEFSFTPNIDTVKIFKNSGVALVRDRDYFLAIDDFTELISII